MENLETEILDNKIKKIANANIEKLGILFDEFDKKELTQLFYDSPKLFCGNNTFGRDMSVFCCFFICWSVPIQNYFWIYLLKILLIMLSWKKISA